MYVSGAINPNSLVGMQKANRLYEQIRQRKSDYINVASNTGFSLEQCKCIKNYIFMDMHELSTGYERFIPDLAIAQSWLRLAERSGKNIQKHDVILLYHELSELIYLLQNTNSHQQEAHHYAELKYNYAKACELYYKG